ncbi:MAG: acetylglutamate kinase [Polyangia bacterium]
MATKPLYLVKLGGEVVEERLAEIAAEVAALIATGARVVVSHGGGPQVTALSARLGLATKMIAGRRLTDAATLEVVQLSIAGKVNVALQNGLAAAGLRAVGITGAIRATKRPAKVLAGAGPAPIDLGHVGDPTGFDVELIRHLLDGGYLPVVACLGHSDDGALLNINADLVANQLARALDVDALVLVTSVPGVMRDLHDPTSRYGTLTVAEGRALIDSGVAKGGMVAKLDESLAAIAGGVRAIYILQRDIAAALAAPGTVGTVLLP